jgi:Cu/Ag efflux protein CusF
MSKLLACAAVVSVLSVTLAGAQTPSQAGKVVKQEQITATATITAIDQKTRSVTIRAEDGVVDTFTVSPEVKRFSELKVGDTIKATYFESLVFQLRKPGDPAPTAGTAVGGGRMEDLPGAKIGRKDTTTVTVKAVDPNVPSITVVTAGGVAITRKVADKKNLEGVKAGDKIDITYTQGVMVSAEPAKK